jgi:hypothetical protein
VCGSQPSFWGIGCCLTGSTLTAFGCMTGEIAVDRTGYVVIVVALTCSRLKGFSLTCLPVWSVLAGTLTLLVSEAWQQWQCKHQSATVVATGSLHPGARICSRCAAVLSLICYMCMCWVWCAVLVRFLYWSFAGAWSVCRCCCVCYLERTGKGFLASLLAPVPHDSDFDAVRHTPCRPLLTSPAMVPHVYLGVEVKSGTGMTLNDTCWLDISCRSPLTLCAAIRPAGLRPDASALVQACVIKMRYGSSW